MHLRYAALLALLFPLSARATTPTPDVQEPPAFLSAVEGRQALDWVGAQNGRTFGVLERDPRYDRFHTDALAIAQSHDRIPTPRMIGGAVYNFWQDAQHRRGIWRRADLASYLYGVAALAHGDRPRRAFGRRARQLGVEGRGVRGTRRAALPGDGVGCRRGRHHRA